MVASTAAILGDPRDNKPPVSGATLHIDPQQGCQPRDLVIDGYIAQMFGPQDAEAYFVSLLKRERRHFQWHAGGMGEFFAAHPDALASDQEDWVIDYAVRSVGPVVQQKIRAPIKTSNKVRRVDYGHLHPPIFFIRDNGLGLGLPLVEAAGGNRILLRGAQEAAPVGTSAHAQIRINVRSISAFIVWI